MYASVFGDKLPQVFTPGTVSAEVGTESGYVECTIGKNKLVTLEILRNGQCILHTNDRIVITGAISFLFHQVRNGLLFRSGTKEVIAVGTAGSSGNLTVHAADAAVHGCCICVVQTHSCYRVEQRIKGYRYILTGGNHCILQRLSIYFDRDLFSGDHLILGISALFNLDDVSAVCQRYGVASVLVGAQCLKSTEA